MIINIEYRVNLLGRTNYRDGLRALQRAVNRGTGRASVKIGRLYRSAAKQHCPVDTGRLKRSLRTRRNRVSAGEYEIDIIVRDRRAFYLYIVNARTGFLARAERSIARQATAILRAEVLASIREAAVFT